MEVSKWTADILSGALAGLTVDAALYPIDTVKTRLQSKLGLKRSGGFRNLYAGIGPVIFGSAPGAAVFFATYETIKRKCRYDNSSYFSQTIVNMFAASLGEIAACIVRVPVEVIKQRAQVGCGQSTMQIFHHTLRKEGFVGLYRGYTSTVVREIPFSLIQFPIWELLKKTTQNNEISSPFHSALCGMVAGGVAAGVTTPLDVAKTRIMLATNKECAANGRIFSVLANIYHSEGARSLFLGVKQRVIFISIGGFVFLGSFDLVKSLIPIKQ